MHFLEGERMKQLLKKNKDEKKAFVFLCTVTLLAQGFFLSLLILLLTMDKYSEDKVLVYEDCTFIRCELKENVTHRSRSCRYLIYTEEYDKPLEIDNIVQGKTNQELLLSIKQGDTIVVSIKDKETLDLYSVSYNNEYILSYEDYLDKHNSNNKIGIIFNSVMSAILLSAFIIEVIYYKKTGRCVPI